MKDLLCLLVEQKTHDGTIILMSISRRNDPVRLFGRRLLIAVFFVLLLVGISGVWNAYQKERESAGLKVKSEAQLRELSERQSKLDSDIAKLNTDRGMEEILREQYALAAKGEQMIIIVNASETPEIATTSPFRQWLHDTFPWF